MDYYIIIKERFFIALFLALIVGIGFVYIKLREVPVYEASASMLIEEKADQVIDIEKVVDTSLRDEAELENHRQQLTSKRMRDWVISKIDEKKILSIAEPYENKKGERPELSRVIQDNLSVSRGRGQRMFHISFTHRNPEMAAFLCNIYAEEYINFILDRSDVSNAAAASFLGEQSQQLKKRVEEGEMALQEYRSSRKLVSLEQSQNLVLDRLKSIDSALSINKVRLLSLETKVARVDETLESGGDPLSLPEIAGFESIPEIQNSLESLVAERRALDEVYLERHPKMVENEAKITGAEYRLRDKTEQAIKQLKNELETTKDENTR